MKVTALDQARPRERRLAVGQFDGVHIGHREVIRGSDTVLTFDPHPLSVIHPEAMPKLLTTTGSKAELLADLGVEEMVVIHFDRDFASVSAQDFIDTVLVEQLGAVRVSVGENFRFGHRASGDVALLREQDAFETRVASLIEVEGEIVSSSHIRGLVAAGDVEHATPFLGAPFRLRRPVVTGDRRGRELGYPTANLVPDDAYVVPGHGVYACRAGDRCAAVNVGVRPTFETGRGLLVEAYLLDWEGDLYGQELTVEFLTRLRGERRFESADALVEAMRHDEQHAREACQRFATVPRR
jgi:riboflavin kinase / FMN adenylyltransferase